MILADPVDINSFLPQLVATLVGSTVVAGVLGALITSLFSYFSNRRNARITERKATSEDENDLVARYRDMAERSDAIATSERSAKESAVKTITTLLDIAQAQIESLKDTIVRLTSTIAVLTEAANVQQSIIDSITAERDKLVEDVKARETAVDATKAELLAQQKDLAGVVAPE